MVTFTSGSNACALLMLLLLAASHLFVANSSPTDSGDEDEDEDVTLEDFLRAANVAAGRRALLGLRAAAHSRARNERAINGNNNNNNNNNVLAGLRRIQRRPELAELATSEHHLASKRATEGGAKHEFFYVISPVSEQVLPIQSEKLAQGFTGLLPLPGGNYETGLRKLSAASGAWPSGHNDLLAATSGASELVGCRAIRTSVELAKDELEPTSGRVVRRCTGRVQLNACEGSCASSIQPSVKSASGFTKKCTCCNEGAFRRVQARLDNCHLPEASGLMPILDNQVAELAGGNRRYMDIEVEEPIDCECRSCDSLL